MNDQTLSKPPRSGYTPSAANAFRLSPKAQSVGLSFACDHLGRETRLGLYTDNVSAVLEAAINVGNPTSVLRAHLSVWRADSTDGRDLRRAMFGFYRTALEAVQEHLPKLCEACSSRRMAEHGFCRYTGEQLTATGSVQ